MLVGTKELNQEMMKFLIISNSEKCGKSIVSQIYVESKFLDILDFGRDIFDQLLITRWETTVAINKRKRALRENELLVVGFT